MLIMFFLDVNIEKTVIIYRLGVYILSNTISARLEDMQATLATYNSIETDISTVMTVLNAVTNESSDVWKGEASAVFNTDMSTLTTQVREISEHIAASKKALVSSINAYKALEEANTNEITVAGENFTTV